MLLIVRRARRTVSMSSIRQNQTLYGGDHVDRVLARGNGEVAVARRVMVEIDESDGKQEANQQCPDAARSVARHCEVAVSARQRDDGRRYASAAASSRPR